MSLTTPPSVQKLQTALHDKAKGSPSGLRLVARKNMTTTGLASVQC